MEMIPKGNGGGKFEIFGKREMRANWGDFGIKSRLIRVASVVYLLMALAGALAFVYLILPPLSRPNRIHPSIQSS